MIFKPDTAFPAHVTELASFIRDLLDVVDLPAGVGSPGLCRGLFPILHATERPVVMHDGYRDPQDRATGTWFTLYGHPWYIVDPYPRMCQQYPLVLLADPEYSHWYRIYRQNEYVKYRHNQSYDILMAGREVEAAIRRHLKLEG